MPLILLFNLPFVVSPRMIVLDGFATLVIVYFENCSSRNNTAFWRAVARQEIYMEFLKNPPEQGSGQPVTCSTSGMGLRLKWISIEMCLVLSLSMASWTTIPLIRRFKVEASSSVMSRYSCMDSTHCLGHNGGHQLSITQGIHDALRL